MTMDADGQSDGLLHLFDKPLHDGGLGYAKGIVDAYPLNAVFGRLPEHLLVEIDGYIAGPLVISGTLNRMHFAPLTLVYSETSATLSITFSLGHLWASRTSGVIPRLRMSTPLSIAASIWPCHEL